MGGPKNRRAEKPKPIRVGFYIPSEINDAMVDMAKEHDCSRNDLLVWLVKKGCKKFLKETN